MSEKIILEMKDKKFNIKALEFDTKKEKSQINLSKDLMTSIKETLVNMGYNYKQVENALQNLPSDLEREV
jgi:Holliday junction resolvasome RuvABC DNA-binding subunit